jgi:hypothetical protein
MRVPRGISDMANTPSPLGPAERISNIGNWQVMSCIDVDVACLPSRKGGEVGGLKMSSDVAWRVAWHLVKTLRRSLPVKSEDFGISKICSS